MNHDLLAIRPAATSNNTTPASSAFPSAYPSEDESEVEITTPAQTFPFLSLPSELRNKIYYLVFASVHVPHIIDLDPDTFAYIRREKLFALFKVSRLLYNESTHHFFR